MKNSREIWIAMILCGYAHRRKIAISEAAEQLLSDGRLNYMEECYEVLHTQSNDDVIDELVEMVNLNR